MTNKNFILWGSSGHAKVLDEMLRQTGNKVVALFDNNPAATAAIPGVPLFYGGAGFAAWQAQAANGIYYGLAAIGGGYGEDRIKVQNMMQSAGIIIEAVVHPRAFVADSARLGRGTQVMANATVAADANLGEACIINHGAVIDHECTLGDGVHIAPNATLCGCISVGRAAFIGAGAAVLPRIVIGAGAIIGAGAVVRGDVPAGAKVVGIPAQPITKAAKES